MALTMQEKEKYEKFISGFSKDRLKKFVDKLRLDLVFFRQSKNISTSGEAKKHYSKEATDAEDRIKLIEQTLRSM